MSTFTTPKGTILPVLDLHGKAYLQVAHRLVWFREERPSWSIETEVRPRENDCLSKAVIKDEVGRIIATAHKTETAKGFPDFIEKSETGAVGRALGLCGFGTQFMADELDEGIRLADVPVPKPAAPQQLPPTIKTAPQPAQPPRPAFTPPAGVKTLSDAQLKRLWAMGKNFAWTDEQFHAVAMTKWQVESLKTLSRSQYDELCNLVQSCRFADWPCGFADWQDEQKF